MVEVGSLEIVGELEDRNIDTGFDKIERDFKNLENQANQSNASFKGLSMTSGSLLKIFTGIGVAGLSAMTALAVKSPVLAGEMAKIRVETMKLSNTVGRQMSPIFQSISGNLIPSINQAFSKSGNTMDNWSQSTATLIDALSDLIRLDWSSLLDNLDKYFQLDVFKDKDDKEEVREKLGMFDDYESTYGAGREIVQDITDPRRWGNLGNMGYIFTNTGKFLTTFLIDSLQFTMNNLNEKEKVYATSNGVSR